MKNTTDEKKCLTAMHSSVSNIRYAEEKAMENERYYTWHHETMLCSKTKRNWETNENHREKERKRASVSLCLCVRKIVVRTLRLSNKKNSWIKKVMRLLDKESDQSHFFRARLIQLIFIFIFSAFSLHRCVNLLSALRAIINYITCIKIAVNQVNAPL